MTDSNHGSVLKALFSSGAFSVAPEGDVFFYTSGLVGPYFINTHYLCGGRDVSERILSEIDSLLLRGSSCVVSELPELILKAHHASSEYQAVISAMKEAVLARNFSEIGLAVSGGERRDWFFSIPLAHELKLPHVFLFKNGQSVLPDGTTAISRTIHVADLLTIGSSYSARWVPILQNQSVIMSLSLNCVDRMQGGEENLLDSGVLEVDALFKVNAEFFAEAAVRKVISPEQKDLLLSYLEDPFNSMKSYLKSRPEFLAKALRSSGKDKERAEKLLSEDLYALGEEYVDRVRSLFLSERE